MTRAGLSENERDDLRDAVMKYVLGSTGAPERFDRTIGLAVEAIVAARTADLAAQVAEAEQSRDEGWAAYREATGIPPSEHQRERLERMATEIEALHAENNRLRAALSPAQPDTERGGRP